MNRTLRDLLIVAAGFATSAATTLVIWLCLHFLHFAIYSFSYWFIPIGAIICGMAAGSGYYFAAQELNHKATRLVLANLLSMSVATFFVVQYLNYYYLDVNGQYVRDALSFPVFLDIVIRHSTVGLAFGPQSGALGVFGYLLVLLPIGGFAIGGWFLYSRLQVLPWCERCGIYLQPALLDARYASVRDEMSLLFGALKELYRQGKIAEAVNLFSKWGLDTPPSGCRLTTDIVMCPCPKCGGQWVHFQGKRLGRDDYHAVPAWYVSGFSPTPVIRQGGR